MALMLRANTAVDVLIGPFVDDSDGNTAETGLTITQADIRLSKNGQNMAQKNDANACTHDEIGYYNCPLDTTDTNTEGMLTLCVHESGALPVRHEFNILAEAAWDSLFSAKDDGFMDVNIKTIGRADTQETEADNLETACSNYSATRGLSGTALPAAAADAAGGLPISDAGGLDLDTQIGTDIDAILADTNELQGDWTDAGRLDAILDAILVDTGTTLDGKLDTIDGIVDDILVDTAEIGAAGAGLTAVGWNAAWDAEVQSEVQDAIEANNLDHLCKTATGAADMTTEVADNTILSRILANGDTSAFDPSTDGLQPIRDHIGDGTNLTEAGGDGDHLTEAGGDGDHLTESGGTGDQLTALATAANLTTVDTVVDSILSMLDDARSEPAQGAPPVNPDMATKVDYLYKFLRNKITTTSSQISVYNDAGDTIDHKSAISDDATTFTRGEFATGP